MRLIATGLIAIALIATGSMPAAAAGAVITGRVVGPDGQGIAEAVVFVEGPLPEAAASMATARTGEMDQVDKTFVPGLLPVVVGTKVRFPNHDQIHHHVYSFSRTKSFELPLYKGEDAAPVLFDNVGVVKIGCNIHDWMSAIILVLPTPWFAQTGADGRFELAALPAGTYKLAAWHALSKVKLEDTEQSVQVGASAPELSFSLSLSPARPRPAMRGNRREP
ncbi:MAG TPA: hypothetical protein VGO53_03975 [Steroidobacteraceae bacterium]|jgi:plastocyanin|nr:hypothetical protein [Steroidobacteraceae bacterium]